MIRDYMPDQHREFYSQLPFIFLGYADGEGNPWASALFGESGFIESPDESIEPVEPPISTSVPNGTGKIVLSRKIVPVVPPTQTETGAIPVIGPLTDPVQSNSIVPEVLRTIVLGYAGGPTSILPVLTVGPPA